MSYGDPRSPGKVPRTPTRLSRRKSVAPYQSPTKTPRKHQPFRFSESAFKQASHAEKLEIISHELEQCKQEFSLDSRYVLVMNEMETLIAFINTVEDGKLYEVHLHILNQWSEIKWALEQSNRSARINALPQPVNTTMSLGKLTQSVTKIISLIQASGFFNYTFILGYHLIDRLNMKPRLAPPELTRARRCRGEVREFANNARIQKMLMIQAMVDSCDAIPVLTKIVQRNKELDDLAASEIAQAYLLDNLEPEYQEDFEGVRHTILKDWNRRKVYWQRVLLHSPDYGVLTMQDIKGGLLSPLGYPVLINWVSLLITQESLVGMTRMIEDQFQRATALKCAFLYDPENQHILIDVYHNAVKVSLIYTAKHLSHSAYFAPFDINPNIIMCLQCEISRAAAPTLLDVKFGYLDDVVEDVPEGLAMFIKKLDLVWPEQ
tara:strand:+ start:48532 stop:49833 length:1302 start_codon:yes stop_codon:yes gene_type:complete